MVYLIEAPGRLSLKEPTVSFGLFHFWTLKNKPNSTEHPEVQTLCGEQEAQPLPNSFAGPSLVGLSFLLLFSSAMIFVCV